MTILKKSRAVLAATVLAALASGVFAQDKSDVRVLRPGSEASASPEDPIRFEASKEPFLSEEWLDDFTVPPRVYRPLQMAHGYDFTDVKNVEYARDQCGLGGVVVNVGGAGYIRKDENWERFVKGVRNLKEGGLRYWIYDEDGYPSLGAGGVVLEGRPDLRAQELAFDPDHDPPYFVRDCYEFTHSSNNVFQARRYPDPLNPESTSRFIDVTHRRYREALGDLFDYAEAFFTDEPAMMAANLGIIQEDHIRLNVPTIDPINPLKKCLPVVSWTPDLEDRYVEAYGEALRPNLSSIFAGDSEKDRDVRQKFWSLLARLDRDRYYGQIRDFCREHPNGPLASGHTLYEENLFMHVPLDGNKLEILRMFDLPGLDMLNSDPVAYFFGSWASVAFPCSAAEFIGQRRVMTEISDFAQVHTGERKPADLAMMEATAGWQAAFGVTDFNLYYEIKNGEYRNEESHRNYCCFVGRLTAALLGAEPVRPVLLVYPIEELQREFKPVPEKYGSENQSERMTQIVDSFNILGAGLSRIQTSFCVADRRALRNLTTNPDDPEEAARIRDKYSCVIFPRWCDEGAYEWANSDVRTYRVSEDRPISIWEDVARELADFAGPKLQPEPANPSVVEGAFQREGRFLFVLTNAVTEPWSGELRLSGVDASRFESDEWTALDPKSGRVESFSAPGNVVPAKLGGRQTLIFVSPASSEAKGANPQNR